MFKPTGTSNSILKNICCTRKRSGSYGNRKRSPKRSYKVGSFGLTHLWEDGLVPYRTLTFILFLFPLFPPQTHTHTHTHAHTHTRAHTTHTYACTHMNMHPTHAHKYGTVWWMTQIWRHLLSQTLGKALWNQSTCLQMDFFSSHFNWHTTSKWPHCVSVGWVEHIYVCVVVGWAYILYYIIIYMMCSPLLSL